MAKGTITGKELIADDVITRLAEVDKNLLKILGTYNQLIKSAQTFNTPSQGNSIITQRNSLDGAFVANQKEKIRLLKAVERQEARNAQVSSESSRNLAKERLQTQLLNRENKEAAILQSKIVGAYRKLNLERSKASQTLRDLVASEKSSNAEIAKAQANFDKLDAKVRKADAAVKDSTKNVGNYKSAFQGLVGGLKTLVGAFGVIQGIRLAFDFGKEAVALAKQAKGVEFAFARLGEVGVKALEGVKASTRGLLSELDIKTALVDFDNFNISLEESATLFEFLAVRSAQTGKSIDSLKDSLVEGLSKESKLRIDNLGISAAQLNDELSKTPNFVKAVANIAKSEIAEAGDILDRAANGTEAWNASWNNLTLSIGQALNQIKGSDTVLNFINELNESQEALNVNWKTSGGILGALRINLNRLTESGRESNKQIIEEFKARQLLNAELKKNTKSYEDLAGALGPLRESDSQTGGNGFTLIDPQSSRTISNINEELTVLNDKLESVYNRRDAQIIQEKINALEEEKKAILGVNETKQTTVRVIEGTIAAYERDIAKQKEFIQTTATTTEEIKQAEQAIIQLQGQIDNLRNGADKILKISLEFETSSIVPTDEIKSFSEKFKEGLKDSGLDFDLPLTELERYNEARKNGEKAYTEFLKSEREKQRDLSSRIFGELFGTFASYYQLDLSAFQDLLEGKKGLEIDYAATINSIAASIVGGKIQNYELEAEKNREVLDAILNDTNSSEKKKLQAQKEFDRKDAELRNKKAKAERDAVLFQISIDTAQSVTKALLNAYALLSNPATAFLAANAFTQAAIAGAFGALQLGFVASKPLPQFFKGKKATDNFEGLATWGERRKEVKVDQYGGIEVSPNRTTPINVKASDIITPSMAQFDREIKNPNSDVFKRVAKRYGQDTVQRTNLFTVQPSAGDHKGIERAVERAMMKYVDRPSVWKGTVKVEQPRKKYHRG